MNGINGKRGQFLKADGTINSSINGLVMVYICAPYGSSGSTDKRLTIGKQYSVRESFGTGGRALPIRYEFIDDFGIGMSLDAINFCTVGEWRSKQLYSILDEK